MAKDYGKAFEAQFKKDWLQMPGASIDRLYDVISGYKSISQICDFIGYVYPNIFYLECKSVMNGNTFPLSNLTQYDKMIEKVGIPGVRCGVVIWFVQHQKVVYVPLSYIKELKENDKKSVNIKTLGKEGVNIFEVPSNCRRIFLSSDYSFMKNLPEGF